MLNKKQNKNHPGMIGPAEEILNRHREGVSGCTGLVIGKHGNLSSAFICICDLITKSLANQHYRFCNIAPRNAQGIFNFEINRRWRMAIGRAWIRLLIDRISILVLGLGDETELGAQVRQRHFYYSRYVCNGHVNGYCPSGRD
jgi:hypothetical protein